MEFLTKMEKLNTWLMEQRELDYGRLANVLGTLLDAKIYILDSERFVQAETGKKPTEDYKFSKDIDEAIRMVQIPTLINAKLRNMLVVPIYTNMNSLGSIVAEGLGFEKEDIAILQVAGMAIGRELQWKADNTSLAYYKNCEKELIRQKQEFKRQQAALKGLYKERIGKLTAQLKASKEYNESPEKCALVVAEIPPTVRRGITVTIEQINGYEGIVDLYDVAKSVGSVASTLRNYLGRLKRAGIIETHRGSGCDLYIKVLDHNLMLALKENQA